MAAGLILAIALLAEPAPAAVPGAEVRKPAETPAKAANACGPAPRPTEPGEIFVCAPRPQGYRIDPDVLEASRGKRALRSGRPKRPERMADTSCAVVGAAGCIGAGAGINLLGAALTAAEMAARLSKGQEIGSLFVTDRQPTEYELYVEAKRAREEREAAAKAAKSKGAAATQATEAGGKPRP